MIERPMSKIVRLILDYEIEYPFPGENRPLWIAGCIHKVMQGTGGMHTPQFIRRVIEIQYPECW